MNANRKYPKTILARVSDKQFQDIKKDAEASGFSVSKYIRHKLTGQQVKSKVDIRVLHGLNRLGGLLKHLYNNGQDTTKALHEITKAAKYLQHHLKK